MSNLLHNAGYSLQTDLYELTMAAGYFQNRVDLTATFELLCRNMPENRSYLVACGLEQIVDYVLNLRFSHEDIRFLKSLPVFKNVEDDFFEYLKRFKFSGNMWAMPEGEIFFAAEPILQVEAPIIEAQILETYLLSIMSIECLVATKASRIVQTVCSDGGTRGVVDFGSRRAHGPDAAVLAARAAYIGGCDGTSNVAAGKRFEIPVYGTFAHSWVEAFDSEEEAFCKYFDTFPDDTILLIDTYDTLKAVKKITELKMKDKVKGVRLDSGNLNVLSKRVRKVLDQAHLNNIRILGSGNLNEYKISNLIEKNSPIDAFCVGTDLVTSRDCPSLDLTYKLVQIDDRQKGIKFTSKKSPKKQTIPGKKQIFRTFTEKGHIKKDVVSLVTENAPKNSRPLLKQIILNGNLETTLPTIDESREYAEQRVRELPSGCFDLKRSWVPDVSYSKGLKKVMSS